MTVTVKTEHYVARREGGRVYCYQVGQGEPLVIIGGARSWSQTIDSFAQYFTCFVLDIPGFDHSDIPLSWIATGRWSIDDYAKAVVEVWDHLGIEKSSVIGDHTRALISVDIAVNHPERVKKLVLDGLPYWNKERGRVVWERYFMPSFTDTTSYDVPVAPLLPPWEEARKKDSELTWEAWKLQDELRRRDRRWERANYEAASSYDTEAAAPRVKAPTLLMYGEGEALRRGEQRALEGIKGSVLKIVPGSPRKGVATSGVHVDMPEEFARLALEFLLEPD